MNQGNRQANHIVEISIHGFDQCASAILNGIGTRFPLPFFSVQILADLFRRKFVKTNVRHRCQYVRYVVCRRRRPCKAYTRNHVVYTARQRFQHAFRRLFSDGFAEDEVAVTDNGISAQKQVAGIPPQLGALDFSACVFTC